MFRWEEAAWTSVVAAAMIEVLGSRHAVKRQGCEGGGGRDGAAAPALLLWEDWEEQEGNPGPDGVLLGGQRVLWGAQLDL